MRPILAILWLFLGASICGALPADAMAKKPKPHQTTPVVVTPVPVPLPAPQPAPVDTSINHGVSNACWTVGTDGWTVICSTPITTGTCAAGTADGTCVYYVSASGSDAGSNTCLVQGSPCKTLAFAVGKLRDGKPDHLLLKKGDTWTDERFGTIAKSGASAMAPMLIGSYGTGARPIVEGSALFLSGERFIRTNSNSNNTTGHFIAVIGIQWSCYDRDPNDSRFTPVTQTGNISVTTTSSTWNLPAGHFVMFRNPSTGPVVHAVLGPGPATLSDPVINPATYGQFTIGSETQISFIVGSGSVTIKGYGGPTTADVTAIEYNNGALWDLFEDNYFHSLSNGLVLQPTGTPPFTWISTDPKIRRNIFADNYGPFSDALFVAGVATAEIVENLIDRNGYNDLVAGQTRVDLEDDGGGGTNHGLYLPYALTGAAYAGSGPITLTGNIISRDIRGVHMRSGGYVTNNLFIDDTSMFDFGRPTAGISNSVTNNVATQEIDISPNNPGNNGTINFPTSEGDGVNYSLGSVVASGNLFSQIEPTSIQTGFALSAVGVGVVSIINNVIYKWASGGLDHGPIKTNNYTGSGLTVSGNQIASTDPLYNNTDPATYPAPDRTIGLYAGTIGLTATYAAFLDAARTQNKETGWVANYSASGANTYIRAGFGL